MSRNTKGFLLSSLLAIIIVAMLAFILPRAVSDVIVWGIAGWFIGIKCSEFVDRNLD